MCSEDSTHPTSVDNPCTISGVSHRFQHSQSRSLFSLSTTRLIFIRLRTDSQDRVIIPSTGHPCGVPFLTASQHGDCKLSTINNPQFSGPSNTTAAGIFHCRDEKTRKENSRSLLWSFLGELTNFRNHWSHHRGFSQPEMPSSRCVGIHNRQRAICQDLDHRIPIKSQHCSAR